MHQVKEANSNIGIDLGVKDFVITSEGEVFDNLHFKKSETKKIKKDPGCHLGKRHVARVLGLGLGLGKG